MNKYVKLVIIGCFISFAAFSYAQTSTNNQHQLLAGLTKVDNQENYFDFVEKLLFSKEKVAGVHQVVYLSDGKRINKQAAVKLIEVKHYIPDVYTDKNNTVKAVLLRPMTAKEKQEEEKMIRQMAQMDKELKKELLGKKAKPFAITDLKGKKVTLESLKGKVVVINFWFIGCKPCLLEMPVLNQLVKKYQEKNVIFLAFALDKKAALKRFLKKKKFDYTIVPESESLAAQYNIESFPSHLILDKTSKITLVEFGELESTDILSVEIDRQLKK